jgi:hypothetical protein
MGLYTSAELKTIVLGELDASAFQTEIDSLWDLWFREAGAAEHAELLMRKRALRFLQGKYRARYDVTQGTEQRLASQLFKQVSSMLKECESDIEQLGGDVPTLGTGHLAPEPATLDPWKSTWRRRGCYGRGKP